MPGFVYFSMIQIRFPPEAIKSLAGGAKMLIKFPVDLECTPGIMIKVNQKGERIWSI